MFFDSFGVIFTADTDLCWWPKMAVGCVRAWGESTKVLLKSRIIYSIKVYNYATYENYGEKSHKEQKTGSPDVSASHSPIRRDCRKSPVK